MIAVAGATKEQLIKRDYEAAINTSLNIGILDYCGVEDSDFMKMHLSVLSDLLLLFQDD